MTKSYIFDIAEWQHFLDNVLHDWIANRASYDDAIIAEQINELLIEPLINIVEKSHDKVPNSNFVEAGIKLITYLDMDLVCKFRNNQTIVLEQISTLKGLVNDFLAIYGSGEFAKASRIKTKIAKVPRIKNAPTKIILLKCRDDYIYREAKERGWIKEAMRKFDISRSKLQKILKS